MEPQDHSSYTKPRNGPKPSSNTNKQLFVTAAVEQNGGGAGEPHLYHRLQFVGVGVRVFRSAHRVASRYFKSCANRIKSEQKLRLY